ncbi:MAG: hypothetical protein K0S45_1790 [Nitrospira sp.]|jgi:hypothetical protein|nr:hypothetical protein [Nitrospira sp.]
MKDKEPGSGNRWSIFDRAVNGPTIGLMETLDGWGVHHHRV